MNKASKHRLYKEILYLSILKDKKFIYSGYRDILTMQPLTTITKVELEKYIVELKKLKSVSKVNPGIVKLFWKLIKYQRKNTVKFFLSYSKNVKFFYISYVYADTKELTVDVIHNIVIAEDNWSIVEKELNKFLNELER